jgi:hypothetical protein
MASAISFHDGEVHLMLALEGARPSIHMLENDGFRDPGKQG